MEGELAIGAKQFAPSLSDFFENPEQYEVKREYLSTMVEVNIPFFLFFTSTFTFKIIISFCAG
jgi:hypothetical protein